MREMLCGCFVRAYTDYKIYLVYNDYSFASSIGDNLQNINEWVFTYAYLLPSTIENNEQY